MADLPVASRVVVIARVGLLVVVKKTTDDAALSRKIVNKVCALKVDFDWLIAS